MCFQLRALEQSPGNRRELPSYLPLLRNSKWQAKCNLAGNALPLVLQEPAESTGNQLQDFQSQCGPPVAGHIETTTLVSGPPPSSAVVPSAAVTYVWCLCCPTSQRQPLWVDNGGTRHCFNMSNAVSRKWTRLSREAHYL